MIASSKHMRLASTVFNAMLKPKFVEGLTLGANSKLEIPLPDDDPVPFEILMNIVHGRSRRVLREVDLTELCSIAALVDKYNMQEAVEAFSDRWIKDLEATQSKRISDDIVSWVFISLVFDKPKLFKKNITKISVQEMKHSIWEFEVEYLIFAPIFGTRFCLRVRLIHG
jgi:hypothetical protein